MILSSRRGSPAPPRGVRAQYGHLQRYCPRPRSWQRGRALTLSRVWIEAPRAFDVDDRASSSSRPRAIGGRLLGDQRDERLCDRGPIAPESRDVLALRLQDGSDQIKGSIVLGVGDTSDG